MDTGSANLPFGVLLATFSLGNIAAGVIQRYMKANHLVVIGNSILVSGLLLSVIVPVDKGYLLNVTYGIMTGFGAGFSYNTNIATIQKWFPDKQGLVTGILICATGAFGLIMNPIALKALNRYGFSGGMLLIAGVMSVIAVLGSGIIKEPSDVRSAATSKDGVNNPNYDYSVTQVLRTPQYYIITLTMMLAVPAYFLINPMLMSLGAQRGLTENVALLGVMIVAVMNTGGRLLAPWLSDYLGRKVMLLMLFALNMLAILGVAHFDTNLFICSVALVGFTYGGFMGMYPTITVDYFGTRHNGINYGAVMFGYGLSSLGCPYLVKVVQASAMGLTLSFLIAAGASLIGFLLVIMLKKPHYKEKKNMKQHFDNKLLV